MKNKFDIKRVQNRLLEIAIYISTTLEKTIYLTKLHLVHC